MPFNLLLFPILGGYYVVVRSEFYRYEQQRVDRQKLIFNSFFAGIVLLCLSWIFTGLVSHVLPNDVQWMRDHYPLKQKYFGTAFCSFLLGVFATEITNRFLDEDRRISRAIDHIGNEFERLCESCYRNTELVQITLKNDKVYIGWMKALPIPSHSSFVSILPVYSGYRDKDRKTLDLTTQYLDVYASYVQEGTFLDIRDITTLVIKIDEVVTATKFDDEMYQRFMNKTPTSDYN